MPSLFTELRRRNVFKVGAAYAIVAWLLIEVSSVLLPTFNAPEWIMQVFTLFVILGFPLALILAWAFDLTPQGIKAASDAHSGSATAQVGGQRLSNVFQGLVFLAVGFLVVDQYVLSPGANVAANATSVASPLTDVSRVTITVPSEGGLARGIHPTVAISPDGRAIVFVVDQADGPPQLYLRFLEEFEAVPMAGTENALMPFFSPDGNWVGFWADRTLQKVSVEGGAPIEISNLPFRYRGASWGPDDIIILGGNSAGLSQVSAGGGIPVTITNIDIDRGDNSHTWPEILPGGEDVLFTIHTSEAGETSELAIVSLKTGQWRTLEGTQGGMQPKYVDSGHLVYGRRGGLFAMRFDLSDLSPIGASAPVVNGVHTRFNAGLNLADFSVSRTGSLVYVSAYPDQIEIVSIDRDGKITTLTRDKGAYWYRPHLSPDGERLAVTYNPGPGSSDIWIQDLTRGTLTRLTTDSPNIHPVWTPDGSRVTFASFKFGSFNLYWQPADLSAEAALLLTREHGQSPESWSPDGQTLAFTERNPDSGFDIWVLNLDEPDPFPVVVRSFNERSPAFSPDGRWLAYDSDESGRSEVYVQPYPGPGPRWPISTDGGESPVWSPVWSPEGLELFYRINDSMMSVKIDTVPTFTAGIPSVLIELPYTPLSMYDVTRDGQHFVMITENQETLVEVNLVLGWLDELNRLAPPSP